MFEDTYTQKQKETIKKIYTDLFMSYKMCHRHGEKGIDHIVEKAEKLIKREMKRN